MVGGVTFVFFTTCFTAQRANQTFIVAIKTMVYFTGIFSGEASEFISNIYTLTNLTPGTVLNICQKNTFGRAEFSKKLYRLQ